MAGKSERGKDVVNLENLLLRGALQQYYQQKSLEGEEELNRPTTNAVKRSRCDHRAAWPCQVCSKLWRPALSRNSPPSRIPSPPSPKPQNTFSQVPAHLLPSPSPPSPKSQPTFSQVPAHLLPSPSPPTLPKPCTHHSHPSPEPPLSPSTTPAMCLALLAPTSNSEAPPYRPRLATGLRGPLPQGNGVKAPFLTCFNGKRLS
ncbi:extensin-like [Penaeus monodon]|uniref:extensin-like n=1 Tax=Penaeus monodon TaxID=6687 RepID=UPI0018A78606|nr:extensin-like [Penaeus monodon]